MPTRNDETVIKIKEVAKLAGVAPSSVSRALNGHPDVSPEMRARVMQAADQLGYQPNFLAQSLRRGATRTVGFVARDISIPLFADIVKGAEQELESKGYSILLTSSLQNAALEAKHINVLRQRRVDALILSLQSEANADTIRALHKVQIPIVLLDRELAGFTADSVLFDHASGMREAVEALVEQGHRRIGLLARSSETRATRDRVRGFRLACAAAGVPVSPDYVIQLDVVTRETATDAVASLLDMPAAPTAIVAGEAQLGVAVLAALNGRKLRPGRDISIVICDDMELFQLLDPPISVVSRDGEKMGAAAARILMRRLADEADGPVHEVLPTNFIARASTEPPSAAARPARRRSRA